MNTHQQECSIRPARPEDFGAVNDLLEAAGLMTLGVKEHFYSFFVAEDDKKILGSAGLELYGDTALIRSLAIIEELRKSGIGTRLYNAALDHARSVGVRRLILFTNTAEEFFSKKGFREVAKSSITGPVTSSVEFGMCHCTCMEKMI